MGATTKALGGLDAYDYRRAYEWIEFERMRDLGVLFTQEPLDMGPVTTAVFDDTCGNLIQIAQRT